MDTPFEGGLYEATLKFPDDFPYQPPKMVFKTEMFHPNSMIEISQSIQQEKYVFRFCIHQWKTPWIHKKSYQRNGTQF